MMKSRTYWLLGSALFMLIALPLRAQNGCENSPENPTIVLALVGGAGAAFSTLRTRLKARRGSKR